MSESICFDCLNGAPCAECNVVFCELDGTCVDKVKCSLYTPIDL